MKQASKHRQPTPEPVPKPESRDPDRPKELAEAAEVAGRHKNSGQKDHKGAR